MSDSLLHLGKAVVVEGKYDKIKLSSIIDDPIIVTNGFRLFKDKEKQNLIRFYAQKTGIVIMTDSDTAGFKIRNMIKNIAKDGEIINVYVPEIFGKEKRKKDFSKEGKIGVEGMDKQILVDSLSKCGLLGCKINQPKEMITSLDFYEDGLSGKPFSTNLRKAFLQTLDLPVLVSTKSLLELVNTIMTKEQYKEIINKINEQNNFTEK